MLSRDEVTGAWRKLHNEEHCHFYYSPYSVRIIRSMRMRLVGHVAHYEAICMQNFTRKPQS